MRLRLLDLFACQGGAGRGYELAGWDVYAVDIDPQPHNPHPFHQGDALEVLRKLIRGEAVDFTHRDGRVERLALADFAAVHASPPCQRFSSITKMHDPDMHPDLLGPMRWLLRIAGLPYVIENVPGAPLKDPTILCGSMFGLRLEAGELRRHRLFESSVPIGQPADGCGALPAIGVYGNPGGSSTRDGRRFSVADWRAVMGLPDMTAKGLAQALPPAYTHYIGRHLMTHVLLERAGLVTS